MAIIGNFADVLAQASSSQAVRTVIMVDEANAVQVYARFVLPYDTPGSKDAVEQLFTPSLETLKASTQIDFTKDELPLLQHLGAWHITIINKTVTGRILIRNGDPKPSDGYLGIGG